jgi:hypothetical protein
MSAHQMNVYQLAENLGMTVTRLQREMTMSEFFGWVAFYSERGADDLPKAKAPGEGISLHGFNLG